MLLIVSSVLFDGHVQPVNIIFCAGNLELWLQQRLRQPYLAVLQVVNYVMRFYIWGACYRSNQVRFKNLSCTFLLRVIVGYEEPIRSSLNGGSCAA